jgi:hypothetical protein
MYLLIGLRNYGARSEENLRLRGAQKASSGGEAASITLNKLFFAAVVVYFGFYFTNWQPLNKE